MRVFRNSCTKNFEKYPEKHMYWSSFLIQLYEYSLQPTAKLKTPPQIFSLKSSGRRGCSEISKIHKKYLQNCFFSLTLQDCNPEFLTSAKKDPIENIFFEFLKQLEVCHKRVYNEVILLKSQDYPQQLNDFKNNHFILFQGTLGKIVVLKVLENSQKNVLRIK